MAKKPSASIEIKADDRKAQMTIGELKKLLKKMIKHDIKITADTRQAKASISELKKPTSSTHTVFVKEIFTKALGGFIAPIHARLGGLIPKYNQAIDSFDRRMMNTFPKYNQAITPIKAMAGRYFPGYGGGDRRLILGEDGEYMLRKEAVRGLGLPAAHAFNNKDIPALMASLLPKIDTAALIASLTAPVQRMAEGGQVNAQGPTETVNLNLTAGGNTLKTTAPKDTTKAFVKSIKRMNIIHGRAKRPY